MAAIPDVGDRTYASTDIETTGTTGEVKVRLSSCNCDRTLLPWEKPIPTQKTIQQIQKMNRQAFRKFFKKTK